jgi:predicted porin
MHFLTKRQSRRWLKAIGWTVLCAACPVRAATVSAYGILDDGVNYVSNESGHPSVKLAAGTMSSNRWGIQGSEALNSDWQTLFKLENGFDLNSGKLQQNGRIFGRQAWLGLSRAKVGTLTVGRQWDVFGDLLWDANASNTFGSWMASHPGDLDNMDSTYKSNQSLKIVSAAFNGIRLGASYAFGNVAGALSRQQIVSMALRYDTPSWSVAGGLVSLNRPNLAAWDGTPQSVGVLALATPVFGGYASARQQSIAALMAIYHHAHWALGSSFSYTRFSGLGSDAGPNPAGYRDDVLFYTIEVNARYQMTRALSMGSFYHFTWGRPHDGQAGVRYHQVGASIDYLLSAQVDVYALAQYQRAAGIDSTGATARANIDGLNAAGGAQQSVVRIGMRYRF